MLEVDRPGIAGFAIMQVIVLMSLVMMLAMAAGVFLKNRDINVEFQRATASRDMIDHEIRMLVQNPTWVRSALILKRAAGLPNTLQTCLDGTTQCNDNDPASDLLMYAPNSTSVKLVGSVSEKAYFTMEGEPCPISLTATSPANLLSQCPIEAFFSQAIYNCTGVVNPPCPPILDQFGTSRTRAKTLAVGYTVQQTVDNSGNAVPIGFVNQDASGNYMGSGQLTPIVRANYLLDVCKIIGVTCP